MGHKEDKGACFIFTKTKVHVLQRKCYNDSVSAEHFQNRE